MTLPQISRYPVPELKDLPEDLRTRILEVQQKAGFVPNVFLALAWLLTNPVMTAPIIGANTPAHLQESLGAAGYRLNAEEMAALNAVTDYPRNTRPIWD